MPAPRPPATPGSPPAPRRPRRVDPRTLDVPAFCRGGAELGGEVDLSSLTRLAPSLLPAEGDAEAAPLSWRARGLLRPVSVGPPQPWIELEARGAARLQCQRCLQPVDVVLEVARPIRFVEGEDEAARLDEDSEDDVLALTHRLDLMALLEDELILALPLVPRHERCPEPLPVPLREAGPGAESGAAKEAGADGQTADVGRPNPFAALARLRKGG